MSGHMSLRKPITLWNLINFIILLNCYQELKRCYRLCICLYTWYMMKCWMFLTTSRLFKLWNTNWLYLWRYCHYIPENQSSSQLIHSNYVGHLNNEPDGILFATMNLRRSPRLLRATLLGIQKRNRNFTIITVQSLKEHMFLYFFQTFLKISNIMHRTLVPS